MDIDTRYHPCIDWVSIGLAFALLCGLTTGYISFPPDQNRKTHGFPRSPSPGNVGRTGRTVEKGTQQMKEAKRVEKGGVVENKQNKSRQAFTQWRALVLCQSLCP